MALSDVCVQMCVTSPPYFGLRDYGHPNQIGLEQTPEAYVSELVSVFAAVRNVMADDGTLWLNLGDSYGTTGGDPYSGFNSRWHGLPNKGKQDAAAGAYPANRQRDSGLRPKNLLGIPWRVAFALQADGWYLRSDIIWHKPNPMPESVTDRPTKAHEYLFLLAKSESYFYDQESIAEPSVIGAGAIRNITPRNKGQASTRNDGDRFGVVNDGTRNRRSVWTVPTQPFDGAHFAVFPRALIEPCILAGSRPRDVVLDPFMGSGTTAQVAEHLGRQWIGCELNPDYLPLQSNRLSQRAMAF